MDTAPYVIGFINARRELASMIRKEEGRRVEHPAAPPPQHNWARHGCLAPRHDLPTVFFQLPGGVGKRGRDVSGPAPPADLAWHGLAQASSFADIGAWQILSGHRPGTRGREGGILATAKTGRGSGRSRSSVAGFAGPRQREIYTEKGGLL